MKKFKTACSLALAVILTVSPICSAYAEEGEVVESIQETIEESAAESTQETTVESVQAAPEESVQELQENSESFEEGADQAEQPMDVIGGGSYIRNPGVNPVPGEYEYKTDDNLEILLRGLNSSNYDATMKIIE